MFKLNFDIPIAERQINLKDNIYLVGSCFSDEIGEWMAGNKFNPLSNPFGSIYNPHSIFKLLRNEASKDNTIESQGVHYHWDCHGQISGLSKSETENSFANAKRHSEVFLSDTNWLIITLGTTIVYRLKSTNEIVANCHKMPAAEFQKEHLTSEEIVSDFENTLAQLRESNPNLTIVFTVSPVRHIKDGLVENNLSKSILLNVVNQIVKENSNVHYFPSYEIMMDELRDYRFYKKDMIHPSEEAVEYIWKRFSETYFDQKTKNFLKKWSKIKSAIQHKPFQPDSEKHQLFIKSTLTHLDELNDLVDVSVEKAMLQKQLS